ncbi:hypothetical protein IGB42_01386 [Andreprevotia sp. IGB-42]|uniref:hypothetical protein n=1 Tax=Andreprevotia sp. IGB-42 TaxID=2497473 RepID=UPI00135B2CB7|nr:hypothetical protein [Andreprevotia sp. IGB-42]KAF0814485.1 hypothetical protein IGB42_01386 [Andreprevotia sp. IGB-42]
MDKQAPHGPEAVPATPVGKTRIAPAFGGIERRADPERMDRINTMQPPARHIIHMPARRTELLAANAAGHGSNIQPQEPCSVNVDEMTAKSVGQVASALQTWDRLTESGRV